VWVLRNQAVLTQLPVWLFSVCPPGTDFMDNEQQPEEKTEFQQAIRPRDLASSSELSTTAACLSLNAW